MKTSQLQKSMEVELSIFRKDPDDEQKVDLFVFLPDDILSEILKRLPEPFLGYRAKCVCRRWMDLISNSILPDRASFILQNTLNSRSRHLGIREEGEKGLQVKVQNLVMPRIGKIRSWCNEFLLISSHYKHGNKRSLYVYNLLKNEGSYLPERDASCEECCSLRCGIALSFDWSTGKYKVVHLYMGQPSECHILILRGDIVSSKWKKIQVPCKNEGWWKKIKVPFMNGLGGRFLSRKPVSVQGYIHWYAYGDKRSLVSIDMVKELIFDISLPFPFDPMDYYCIFDMSGSLALCAGVSRDKCAIWILKDFQTNKWEKLQSVTLEKLCSRHPVCGVTNNKYIILICYVKRGMWYYDLKNGVLKELDIHIGLDDYFVVHSSLPSIKSSKRAA